MTFINYMKNMNGNIFSMIFFLVTWILFTCFIPWKINKDRTFDERYNFLFPSFNLALINYQNEIEVFKNEKDITKVHFVDLDSILEEYKIHFLNKDPFIYDSSSLKKHPILSIKRIFLVCKNINSFKLLQEEIHLEINNINILYEKSIIDNEDEIISSMYNILLIYKENMDMIIRNFIKL